MTPEYVELRNKIANLGSCFPCVSIILECAIKSGEERYSLVVDGVVAFRYRSYNEARNYVLILALGARIVYKSAAKLSIEA